MFIEVFVNKKVTSIELRGSDISARRAEKEPRRGDLSPDRGGRSRAAASIKSWRQDTLHLFWCRKCVSEIEQKQLPKIQKIKRGSNWKTSKATQIGLQRNNK